MVAFSEHCLRIGYGGGFYDRTIKHMREQGHKFLTIGLAFEA